MTPGNDHTDSDYVRCCRPGSGAALVRPRGGDKKRATLPLAGAVAALVAGFARAGDLRTAFRLYKCARPSADQAHSHRQL